MKIKSKDVMIYIVPSVIGLLSGLIGTCVGPWVNWGVEKQRLQYESRKEIILQARKMLEEEGVLVEEFSRSAIYSQIRPYLSEKAIKAVERKTNEITVVTGAIRNSGVNPFKTIVLDDLVQLEKKWELLE